MHPIANISESGDMLRALNTDLQASCRLVAPARSTRSPVFHANKCFRRSQLASTAAVLAIRGQPRGVRLLCAAVSLPDAMLSGIKKGLEKALSKVRDLAEAMPLALNILVTEVLPRRTVLVAYNVRTTSTWQYRPCLSVVTQRIYAAWILFPSKVLGVLGRRQDESYSRNLRGHCALHGRSSHRKLLPRGRS